MKKAQDEPPNDVKFFHIRLQPRKGLAWEEGLTVRFPNIHRYFFLFRLKY